MFIHFLIVRDLLQTRYSYNASDIYISGGAVGIRLREHEGYIVISHKPAGMEFQGIRSMLKFLWNEEPLKFIFYGGISIVYKMLHLYKVMESGITN